MAGPQRLPPQGGLPPLDDLGAAVAEIACDESGFSGRNLLDRSTPVFTHASVDLRADEAADLIGALRSGFGWPVTEVKSAQFLRGPRASDALEWLLAALTGRAHVHVIDKEFFLVTRIVDFFLAEPSYAAGTRLTGHQRPAAVSLYRAGRAQGRDWNVFLAAFAEMVRAKKRHRPDADAASRFFQARDALARARPGADAEGVLSALTEARVTAVLARLARGDRSLPPPLEPMLPALAETVLFWSDNQRPVLVIHDEQSALTAERLRRLQNLLTDGTGRLAGTSRLAGLVTVDSRDDPRVQVADLLAGVARRLSATGDDVLLGPFRSPTSRRGPSGPRPDLTFVTQNR